MESSSDRVVDLPSGLMWARLPDGLVCYVNGRWRERAGLDHDDPGLNRSTIVSAIRSMDLERDARGKPFRALPLPGLSCDDARGFARAQTSRATERRKRPADPMPTTPGRELKNVALRNGEPLTAKRPVVCLVDDDESVRESLPDLLRELGYEPRAFASAKDFLASDCVALCECLILDIAMPDMSGPELLAKLRRQGCAVPTVFITAQTDERVRPRVLEQGAAECLFKPFSQAALLESLDAVFQGRRS